jgi:hypothetical protein
MGSRIFRHVRSTYLFGYQLLELGNRHYAFVATPEKALPDLIYLTPDGDSEAYIRSLRLQNLKNLDMETLASAAEAFGKRKLKRAAELVGSLV